MAAPVLVRAYPNDGGSPLRPPATSGKSAQALPPISSYAFADILRTADCAEFQQAIDGIAEICAKNRMSLADEHSSHLPPLGEITAASSASVRPHLLRPGMRRALTSVPEASSGSSEGSRKSKKKASRFFSFSRKPNMEAAPARRMRIGSMGRMIAVNGTTAMTSSLEYPRDVHLPAQSTPIRSQLSDRRPSEATASLQQLLARARRTESTDD